MARQYYSRAHYSRLSNGGPDTSAMVAERVRNRAAGERAHREMLARFAPLSEANVGEALAWQEQRIRELRAEAL